MKRNKIYKIRRNHGNFVNVQNSCILFFAANLYVCLRQILLASAENKICDMHKTPWMARNNYWPCLPEKKAFSLLNKYGHHRTGVKRILEEPYQKNVNKHELSKTISCFRIKQKSYRVGELLMDPHSLENSCSQDPEKW